MKPYKETWRAIVGWQEFFTRSNLLAREGVLPNQVSILKLVIPEDIRTHRSIGGYQPIYKNKIWWHVKEEDWG